ncbi:MAG: sigma-70 family RNA polymerase sigma factor [Phycisphaerae bacterium]
MTERELIQRCRDRDREAQREAYARTCRQIYRLLIRMTGNEDDALDLTQETYVRAFSRIHEFDGRSTLATWLYRIAFNQALQLLRGADKTKSKLRLLAAEDRAESSEISHTTRLDVNDALATLKPADRAILLLRYQEGLDYRAIAETMGSTMGTVASRLNRARSRLRELLQKSYEFREGTTAADHPKNVRGVSVKEGPQAD